VTTLLVEPAALDGAEVRVEGEAYRHLFRAARLRVGDPLRVADGRGRARRGRVARVERRAGVVALAEEEAANEASRRVELFVAPPRPQRAAWLVEKATEVGCAAVRFVAAGRAPRRFAAAQIQRLGRVARAAVEQCDRSRVPEVTGTHAFDELPRLLEPLPARWFLDPAGPAGAAPAGALPDGAFAGEAPAAFAAGALPPDLPPAAVLIGPEGGWSAEEGRRLAAWDCRPVSLGPRTLRVETAAVAAAALLLLR
jgi:16S rRNA (uracil1498-N3)-methyltransferase